MPRVRPNRCPPRLPLREPVPVNQLAFTLCVRHPARRIRPACSLPSHSLAHRNHDRCLLIPTPCRWKAIWRCMAPAVCCRCACGWISCIAACCWVILAETTVNWQPPGCGSLRWVGLSYGPAPGRRAPAVKHGAASRQPVTGMSRWGCCWQLDWCSFQ